MKERDTLYNYSYNMLLSLARAGDTFSEEERRLFAEGVTEYNRKSMFMANPKKLELVEAGDSFVRVRLLSTNVLTTPGRGLRALTAILLKSSDSFGNRVTKGGQLFRVVDVDADHSRSRPMEGTQVDPALITDLELLKALMDYVVLDRKDGSAACRAKKAAVQEMKRLAAECGILSAGGEGEEK